MRASRRTHLLLAELLWTVVGTGLFSVGTYWVLRRYGPAGAVYLLPFAALGFAKGFFVLDRVARKAVQRIRTRGDGRHVLGLFSLRMWTVALSMMALGQLLRHTELPRADLGFAYVAVGAGLLFASRNMWSAWWQLRNGGPGSVGIAVCETTPSNLPTEP